jgi:Tol biopolymer transport system component
MSSSDDSSRSSRATRSKASRGEALRVSRRRRTSVGSLRNLIRIVAAHGLVAWIAISSTPLSASGFGIDDSNAEATDSAPTAALESEAREPTRLTSDGFFKSDPVVVGPPDRAIVVYSVQRDSIRPTLVELDLGDGSSRDLHPGATMPEFRPSFDALGETYVFIQSRGNQNLTLVVRSRGKDGERHIHGMARHPVIYPDGSRVLVSHPEKAAQHITSYDLEGKDPRAVVATPHFNHWPAISPDGKRLAFASDRDGNLEIYVADIDGANPRRITESPERDLRPAWSPDAKRIAWASSRGGQLDIFVVDVDGGAAQRLTETMETDDYPTWHPDGKRIIYVAERNGAFDLWSIAVDPGTEDGPECGAESANPPDADRAKRGTEL